MSSQDPDSQQVEQQNMAVPPGVVAQAEAIAAGDEGRKNSSTASQDIPASVSGQTNTQVSAAPEMSSRRSGKSKHGRSSKNSGSQRGDPSNVSIHDTPIEDVPPPAYSETYGQVDMDQEGLDTRANIANDGRINININQKSRRLSNLLVPALRSQLNLQHVEEPPAPPPGYIPPSLGGLPGQKPPPPMNVVIHVVGSRGDVQPFVSLGQVLKSTYGHRVRLATHPTFRDFVEENGLEFFSIGGNPAELMAFMVKNPGLMPGKDALRSGDIGKRRKGMYEIVKGCWRSCFEAGDGTGVEVSDSQQSPQRTSIDSGVSLGADLADKPFVADAIIANPPSFAHVHCAEKLGIPLHLMFTMPWSPTQAFPHPLANIQSSNADVSMTNFISYALVEMMTWQGLGDVINRFREKSLGLDPVSLMWAPGMASRLRIPYTYCWSPALIPKPKDWGSHISVSGFYFLSLANNYTPSLDLKAFLDAGPPPIYIGFGSIVLDDPNAMTKLIFEAVKLTGQRALVSKGWGGFGADELGIPEDVFMLGNVPHDWLFKHVSCVVHHGGAGTTAAGIATGKPTVIVPFFGDQPFWGAMVAKAGAGPQPIPNKQLTAENLAEAILEALKPAALERAQELGAKISEEKGSDVGGQKFHEALNIDKLRCSLAPSHAAVWRVKKTEIRLSGFAAAALGNEGLLNFSELKLYRPREYDTEDGPWDPISGGASALLGTMGSMMMGVADFPIEIFKALSKSTSSSSTGGDSKPSSSTSPSSSTLGLTTSQSSCILPSGSRSPSTNASTTTLSDSSQNSSDATTPVPIYAIARKPLSPLASNQQRVDYVSTEPTSGQGQTDPYERSPPASTISSSPSRMPSQQQRPDRSPSRGNQMTFETALAGGKGVGRIVGAGLKSPLDFTLGIAKGFHNAPKLYGDQSVRQADKVTDFQSGLKAAGREFGFGFYDGISGLVTQPIDGAKKEGMVGALKGFGKGVGGMILKPAAAIWGLPGYTFQGIYKELQKQSGSSVQNYIIAARTAQGYEDWRGSTPEERLDVVKRWHAAQIELGKQRKQWSHRRSLSPHGFAKTKHMSFEERKRYAEERKKQKHEAGSTSNSGVIEQERSAQAPTIRVATPPDEEAFENAIRTSVEATSTGNPHEDELIERAIRASVAELRRGPQGNDDDDDAVARAIQASIAEANRARSEHAATDSLGGVGLADDHDEHLEAALRMSMRGHDGGADDKVTHEDWDDSGIDTDDDENMKRALEDSKNADSRSSAYHDEEYQRALKESQEQEEAQKRERTEEEIVMEYVKKQSLAEEEHRKKMVEKGKRKEGVERDDEELETVMKESLRVEGKQGEAS